MSVVIKHKQQIQWIVNPDVDVLNRLATDLIIETLMETLQPVIGFATGSTPLGLYQTLVKRSMESPTLLERWRNTVGFNLDEYVGLPEDHPQSYYHYMWDNVYQYLPVLRKNVHIPKGTGDMEANCQAYEGVLEAYEWPHLQILGIGKNGHIGFNEPSNQLVLRTHVTSLSETTRIANARFFPSLDDVPREAVTMGIGGILQARQIVLLAFGEAKREALVRAFSGSVGADCPASFLQLHPRVTLFTDLDWI